MYPLLLYGRTRASWTHSLISPITGVHFCWKKTPEAGLHTLAQVFSVKGLHFGWEKNARGSTFLILANVDGLRRFFADFGVDRLSILHRLGIDMGSIWDQSEVILDWLDVDFDNFSKT